MTLVVSAFWVDPVSGKTEELTDWEEGHYMAGAEASRQSLWGSEAVRGRGATFLPQLAKSNLWVGPEDLDAFEAEVRMLASDLSALQAEFGWSDDSTLAHYLANFLRAVEYARTRRGGINIT
jgi:hypothetical protein